MNWSLRPDSNGLPAVYKTAALPGELRRHRVLGAIRTHTSQRLMLVPPAYWATRTSEPPSGADPDRPPYESGAAAVRGGMASGAGLEPAKTGVRALLGTPTPHPEPVRKAGLEPAVDEF